MMDNWWKLVIPWEFHVETACKIYSFDFLKEIDLTDERYCCGDIAAYCEQFAGMFVFFDSFLVIKKMG